MKTFEPFTFDPPQCRKEVGDLGRWLERRPQLDEKKHILPFFRRRRQLAAFIAAYSPSLVRLDRIAYEYPLFGDFACDLVVGDSARRAYCFIEFEDAGPNSLFVKQGRKATREWSPRFDHGYSQIIDWFHKLDDFRRSDDFVTRFGSRSVHYSGVLVVGRDQYLLPGERERLEWRQNNVVVGSRHVKCVTLDGLLADLQGRLEAFPPTARAGG
jgi:hypothetical protein